MAATQEYESIAMDAEDDGDDDIDEENDDIESPPKKLSPPKKRSPKKRRAPPQGGGCCRSFCSFFCAFLLAFIVVLGLLGGAYYALTQKGYRFSATQSDDNASDSLWLGHGWHRPKSLDSQDAITGESSDDTNITGNTMSRGHNTEGQQPPSGIPQQEAVPVVHKPSHISVTNKVPGVSVVVVQKPGSTATTGVDVEPSDPTASPTTPTEASPTNEQQPTMPPGEDEPEPHATPEDESQEETTHSDADKTSDDDVMSKFRSSPP